MDRFAVRDQTSCLDGSSGIVDRVAALGHVLCKSFLDQADFLRRRELAQFFPDDRRVAVCTENLIRVDDVMESPKLAE